MKANRKYLALTIATLTVVGAGVYQNCGGTQERSTDLSISMDQVNAYLTDLQCAVSGGAADSATTTAITNIGNIENQGNSTIFYSEAPSAMGNLNIVAPLDYATMGDTSGSTPQHIYGFFAVGDDGTASLVIAIADSSGTGSVPQPTPQPVGNVLVGKAVVKKAGAIFKKAQRLAQALDSTGSSPCASSNPLNLTTAVAAYNDGSLGLEPASFDGDIFEMELSLDGLSVLRVRSYDVQDGELQSTIQLEINQVDPNSGQEIYLGDINLTQPD